MGVGAGPAVGTGETVGVGMRVGAGKIVGAGMISLVAAGRDVAAARMALIRDSTAASSSGGAMDSPSSQANVDNITAIEMIRVNDNPL